MQSYPKLLANTTRIWLWCQNGEYHREDGPAIERDDGSKEWWYRGKHIDCQTQEEFERLIKLKEFW